jgi:hypothetical protein
MPKIREEKTGLNCKVENNVCRERQQGSYGKCRLCEFSTMTRIVEINMTMRDYQFISDLCKSDGTDITISVSELVNQGIKSLRRHTELKGEVCKD